MQAKRPTPQLNHQLDLQRLREVDPYFSGTLAKGLLILRCFVSNPRAHANSELADLLGMSRSTVSRLCRTLLTMGFLDHDERLDRYFIGPAAVSIAYPYVINTPALTVLRPAMQALADRVKGAVSVGVTSELDVVYIETCAYQAGTLKRPGVGAVRGIAETAMGRAWLAQRSEPERAEFMHRMQLARPEELARCAKGVDESMSNYAKHGFSTNFGDSGMGVVAVGVASKIKYGTRQLLFNCAVTGFAKRQEELVQRMGEDLVQLVFANYETDEA